jgi:hypothetical protein
VVECATALGVPQAVVGKKPVTGEKDMSKRTLPATLGMTRVISRRDKASGKVCV